jgi:hypothetical protein
MAVRMAMAVMLFMAVVSQEAWGSVEFRGKSDAAVGHYLDPALGGLDEYVGRASACGLPGEYRASGVMLDSGGGDDAGGELEALHGDREAGFVWQWFHLRRSRADLMHLMHLIFRVRLIFIVN